MDEQQQQQPTDKRKAYSSAFWLIVVAAYILISFATRAWHITWIIFLIGAAAEQIMKAAFMTEGETQSREHRVSTYTSAMWMIIVVLYFVISFTTGAWAFSWVIFLIGAAVQQIVKVNIK
ncbi:MAG: hypothetical protein VB081_02190 [Christensenella sp.]|uniref:hypothetical protein n=1 Tax=Christensenella sp. TaxID=1935934 RepID=UPI002B207AF4|nr:hypothetical protein [Christensenella sp.]MEA5002289.1 hypothetical protein [Christensenella sp.]